MLAGLLSPASISNQKNSPKGIPFESAKRHPALMLAPHVVSRVRDYIRSNIDQRITLEDLAAVGGYSRFHFVRAFKESTGLPPYSYLLQERIAIARDLLRHSSLPIAEVARRCGFTTHAHFSIRFREAIGLTPAEYRRRPYDGGDASFKNPGPTEEYTAR